jgi:predicted DNA-binding transcriptional regulator AlpA
MYTFEKTQQDVLEVKNDLKELKAFLLNRAENQSKTDNPLTIDEVVELTSYTKNTIYGYCQKNEIPHHKKNGRLFFFASEIIDWIKLGKQKTIKEIEADTDTFLSNNSKKN